LAEISLIDHPVKSLLKLDGTNADMLQIESYARALAKFTMECGTPLTIGVQGEWGSGKTSLLNMIQDIIENTEVVTKGRGGNIKGSSVYKSIWINTWEHSLLKNPEECLLSIIEEIIDAIAALDGSWKTAQKAKSALNMLARGAVRIGAAVALGQEAASEIGGAFGSSNSVKSLRTAMEQSINELINRDQNTIERFVIFVDDLDRLDPTVAVMILELLKNIFNINHCVFILAIDYQVVVKGLKHKFGEPDEQNEWEFRAFFDKIIQLPFMMPMGVYDLNGYVENLLFETSYFSKREMSVLKSSKLSNIVKLTVGANPRGLKRLVNSLSLILIQREFAVEKLSSDIKDNELVIKQLLIALVCLQISFPKLYNTLVRFPIFYDWDDDFVNRIADPGQLNSQELQTALQNSMDIYEEDFDEAWEQSLFKILWSNGWHKNRIVDISRAFTIIKEKVLILVPSDDTKQKLLVEALRLTAVTSVVSTEEKISSDDDKNDNKLELVALWNSFTSYMNNTSTCFAKSKKSSTYSSQHYEGLAENLLDGNIAMYTYSSSKMMLKVQSKVFINVHEVYSIFNWLKRYEKQFEEETGIKPVFKITPNRNHQYFVFYRPRDLVGDMAAHENKEIKEKVFMWLKANVGKIESIIKGALEDHAVQNLTDEVGFESN
jgi:hypothetical protein